MFEIIYDIKQTGVTGFVGVFKNDRRGLTKRKSNRKVLTIEDKKQLRRKKMI